MQRKQKPWYAATVRIFLIVTALSAVNPGGASSQAPGQGGGATDSEARTHFVDALAHFEHRRYGQALREFELVQRLAPSAELWFNIARCHEELGNPRVAVTHLQSYLRDRVDADDRDRVQARIERLLLEAAAKDATAAKPDAGSIRVLVADSGALISVDGRRIGYAPLPEPLVLTSGEHRLDVRLAGRIPHRSRVSIYPRSLTRAHVELSAPTSYDTVEPGHPWTWTIGSIAVAAAALGLGFAVAEVMGEPRESSASGASTAAVLLPIGAIAGFAAVGAYFVESSPRVQRHASALVQP